MHDSGLLLPPRAQKPRDVGLTMVLDPGLGTRAFTDLVESHGDLIDVVKFGWGTSVVTTGLQRKIDAARANGVDFYFGGTLFERFVLEGAFDAWRSWVDRFGATTVEVSNGTIELSNSAKAEYIARLAPDYLVYSEVGLKDGELSEQMTTADWLDYMREDLAAGSAHVITEARESGKSGIFTPDGEPKLELIDAILGSELPTEKVMFEAPTKEFQTLLITRLGPDVNLGNIATDDAVALETLRLGLRSDTLDHFAPHSTATNH